MSECQHNFLRISGALYPIVSDHRISIGRIVLTSEYVYADSVLLPLRYFFDVLYVSFGNIVLKYNVWRGGNINRSAVKMDGQIKRLQGRSRLQKKIAIPAKFRPNLSDGCTCLQVAYLQTLLIFMVHHDILQSGK